MNKGRRTLVLAAALALPLGGCGADRQVVQPCTLALGVNVDPPAATATAVGQTVTFTASAAGGCDTRLKWAFDWTLSQPAVATIEAVTDTSARVRAISAGTTSVIATAREHPSVGAAAQFTFIGLTSVPPAGSKGSR